ncbi:MAG: hypothetical protein KatS3mg102_0413 [Planctomycetota bacterium]|nr:MAG: hypothetical protein KatS3mg102_0413 [Planctomycetota bacterium]
MIDEQLEREIAAAIEEVRRARAEGIEGYARHLLALEGKHPYRVYRGVGAAWNFTIGPVLRWRGPSSIDAINRLAEPAVVVADYIDEQRLRRIHVTRVRGFVIGRGSIIDPTFWWYVQENRAAVVGCAEAVAAAREGELAIVDGVRGVVYLDPDPDTYAIYERLREIGPPRRDQLYWDALEQLCVVLMGNRRMRKIEPPYDFPEQERLLDLARRARRGEPITEEDNAWMQALLMEGMPSIDEIQQRALGKTVKIDGLPGSGGAGGAAAAPAAGPPRGAARQAAALARRGSSPAADEGEQRAPAPAADSPPSSAAERRRQRLEQIQQERQRRRGEPPPGPKPPAEQPPAEPPPAGPAGGGPPPAEDFDPLGDMYAG